MASEAQGDEQTLVTLEDIEATRPRLQRSGMVVRTPLLRDVQAMFPEVGNLRLHLKLENMQTTGSFKIRGVVNQLGQVIEETQGPQKRSLVTMSAGNYGRAFAHYLQRAGVPGVCVMPITVPDNRVALIKSMGVRVEQCPTSEIQSTVDQLVREEGCIYCHSFDDRRLIAAYGTCSLEVLEEGLQPDVVVVCCGGGGLVSGIAAAFHLASKKPVKVYAVEPEGSNAMWESMRAGHAVTKPPKSVASGLSPPFAGKLCYAHCRQYVEAVLLVSDQEILQAMGTLLHRGLKAEPSGCAAMAALLCGRVPDVEGKDVLVVVTGGNVSVEELHSHLPSPLGGGVV
ncbi:L-threonine ammonia-lyase-like [Babylonia areolata]|uniref:L-threonine ammonia-lyase-like n=1 Tax=Babylonia areolata TaxID=304850 RepID=UPI003FD0E426